MRESTILKKGSRGSQSSRGKGARGVAVSFPVLVQFVCGFAAAVGGSLRVGAQVHFVHLFEGLAQVVLQRGHGRADGRRAEAVADEAEVGQAALNARLQDGRRTRVTQRRAVLGEQVGELLADLPAGSSEEGTTVIQFTFGFCTLLCNPVTFCFVTEKAPFVMLKNKRAWLQTSCHPVMCGKDCIVTIICNGTKAF